MRPRTLSYSDAVRLLGAADSPVVDAVGRLTSAAAGAVAVASVGTVDFFALRDELVRWGNEAAGEIRERASGLRRFDRTQRLVAAHAVIVITAFYEALDEVLAGHPEFDLTAAELTAAEQVAMATGAGVGRRYVELVRALVDTPPPAPAPHRPFEETLEALGRYYTDLGDRLERFLLGLRAFEQRELPLPDLRLAPAAVARYEQAYRSLVTQAPEFGVWSGMVDAQATRATVRASAAELRAQLAQLRSAVADTTTVDAVRRGLGRRHRAELDRAVLASSHAPEHVVLPTLDRAYVDPQGQVKVAGPADRPATETWWQDSVRVPDVQDFLLAHLTSPGALTGPLVLLGQPGSGKSALTRVLAGRLPETDFLVVRVELRSVPMDTSIQGQIEATLYHQLGEQVGWPDLVRRAGTALPVVIMDGFDELLQATGLNRADYLEQIQDFQRREAELDRPVAVLVTSRTVVADRARCPEGSVVVRLNPFDETQVRDWLAVWNGANEASLRTRSLRSLPAEVALAHRELAGQPLLLLLLALYDAGANVLQNSGDGLGRVELYERLFADFVHREVDKHQRGQSAEQRQREIDTEWRRLCAVALALLNRGGDVILETELDQDIPHLLGPGDLRGVGVDSAHRTLTVSQLLVGRFFFIHEARAVRDTGSAERSFEFLHATFGDYLAARLVVEALRDLAAERIHQRRRPQSVLDAGFFFAATSFVTVTRRAPLWEFCQGMLARLAPQERRICRELVVELLPDAGYFHPTWSLAGYQPRTKPYAARHAAFSANLVCFAVLLSDGPVDVVELVGEPAADSWRRLALLWRSQLDSEDRQRMWQLFRVAWRLDVEPSRLEIRLEDGSDIGVFESLPWPPDSGRPLPYADATVSSDSRTGHALRRSAFIQTTHDVRELLYDLIPAWELTRNGDWQIRPVDGVPLSATGGLLQLLLTPPAAPDERHRQALYIGALNMSSEPRYRRLVLGQLSDDASTMSGRGLMRIVLHVPLADLDANLDQLARLVAVVADRDDLGDGPAAEIFVRIRLLSGADGSRWPPAAREQFVRAFAAVGRELPDWVQL